MSSLHECNAFSNKLLEPEAPQHFSTIKLDELVVPKWVPNESPYVGVHSLLTGAPSSDLLTFGCTAAVLKVIAAVQAIECSGESARIDTKTLTALVNIFRVTPFT